MSLQRVPRVFIRLEMPPTRKALREVSRMLERHLSPRFCRVRSSRFNILPVSHLMLTAEGNEFVITLMHGKRGGQDDGAWLLTINPLGYPVPMKNLSKEEEMKYSKGLRIISDEIDALLISMPSVTRHRWFFEGWDAKKPGMRTPAELPWQSDVAESRGTESQR
jgi:hypothetical protein